MRRGLVAAALALAAACDGGRQVVGWALPPGALPGDRFAPWPAADYYRRWPRTPWGDPATFPISVWMQSPANAGRYAAAGVNLYVGLWEGPTDEQLAQLAATGMPAICDQAGAWSAHVAEGTIGAWMQPDGPDNAQQRADGGYDPCVPPAEVLTRYRTMTANDPSRPVYLGLGRGVADPQWIGRGDCTGRTDMYPAYAAGGDILAYMLYAVNAGYPLEGVAAGADNLRAWSGGTKPVFAVLEASNIDGVARPTPAQIEAEVWMAIVHGANGIQYFCHRFMPTFSETDCLDDAPTAAALTAINAQLRSLAPVLNAPPVSNGVAVTSSNAAVPVDAQLKRTPGASYLFAVAMRGAATSATFTLRGLPGTLRAEVLGESRTITVSGGVLRDDFAPYAVHRYRIASDSP